MTYAPVIVNRLVETIYNTDRNTHRLRWQWLSKQGVFFIYKRALRKDNCLQSAMKTCPETKEYRHIQGQNKMDLTCV